MPRRREPEGTSVSPSLLPDPFQMWRDAVAKLEGDVNSLVTGSMDSPEMMRSVHQLSRLSLGAQQAFERAVGACFAKLNLPSRKDITALAAALQRVEDKLDRLLPAAAAESPPPSRPARTRRPPGDVAEVSAQAPPAPAMAPARRKAARARRRS